MPSFWLKIVKPASGHAKWLVLALLVIIFWLGVSGHLDMIESYLDSDSLTFYVMDMRISLYEVLRGIIALILLFWVTAIISDFSIRSIRNLHRVKVGTREIISKFVQIFVYFVAFLVAMELFGIDLTTLAIFSGAIGIGLGFGLQKIASNFISGLILLFEKSVEIDDLIELSDSTLGFVRHTGARFTLLETFDTREILVPNEDLITGRVVNWTLSNPKARIEIKVGVSYKSDIALARDVILEAANEHPDCASEPKAVCYLEEFAESSVNFVLWFWINDVTKGRYPVRSAVMFSIWNKLAENGIQIPYPQRDVHMIPVEPSG